MRKTIDGIIERDIGIHIKVSTNYFHNDVAWLIFLSPGFF